MELLEMIKDAGIIGAGGAGFPTHVKLAAKADYILLNGAECEPLLRVDQQLMEFYPDDVIRGFEMAGRPGSAPIRRSLASRVSTRMLLRFWKSAFRRLDFRIM